MVTIIEAVSSVIESNTKVERIVPNILASKHFKFKAKHFSNIQQELLHELSIVKIKIDISAKLAIPKATHIPVKIKGVSPKEKRIATITPTIIPKIIPMVPQPQLQPILLCVFIFINSSLFIL